MTETRQDRLERAWRELLELRKTHLIEHGDFGINDSDPFPMVTLRELRKSQEAGYGCGALVWIIREARLAWSQWSQGSDLSMGADRFVAVTLLIHGIDLPYSTSHNWG